jgi:hypothetical protein
VNKPASSKLHFRKISTRKVAAVKAAFVILTLLQRVFPEINSVVSSMVYKCLVHSYLSRDIRSCLILRQHEEKRNSTESKTRMSLTNRELRGDGTANVEADSPHLLQNCFPTRHFEVYLMLLSCQHELHNILRAPLFRQHFHGNPRCSQSIIRQYRCQQNSCGNKGIHANHS